MRSFLAALRNLVLPYGTTSGQRIVLNSTDGVIQIYDSNNVLVGSWDATEFFVGSDTYPAGATHVFESTIQFRDNAGASTGMFLVSAAGGAPAHVAFNDQIDYASGFWQSVTFNAAAGPAWSNRTGGFYALRTRKTVQKDQAEIVGTIIGGNTANGTVIGTISLAAHRPAAELSIPLMANNGDVYTGTLKTTGDIVLSHPATIPAFTALGFNSTYPLNGVITP